MNFTATVVAVVVLLAAIAALVRMSAQRRGAEARARQNNDLLESVIRQMGEGLIVADEQGRFVLFNPAAERLLGAGMLDTAPDKWAEHFHIYRDERGTPVPSAELPLARARRGESVDTAHLYVVRREGAIWVSASSRPIRDSAGTITGALVVFRDISEARRSRSAVEHANEQLQHTVERLAKLNAEKTLLGELGDVLHSCLTVEETFDAVRRAAPRLFPGSSGCLYAVNASHNQMRCAASWGEMFSDGGNEAYEPHDCWAVRRGTMHTSGPDDIGGRCRHAVSGESTHDLCVPLITTEGTLAVLHVALPSTGTRQDDTAIIGDFTRTASTTAQLVAPAIMGIRLRDKLHAQSIRDPLTGLFNRRYMEESLDRDLHRAGRSGRPLSLIMLDVDQFKRFNDQHGHPAGDAALRELGALLGSLLRGGDIACRCGGEEFALVLPDASLEATRAKAETIRNAIADLAVRLPTGGAAGITVSQGIATFPEHGTSAETLMHAADLALYDAKRKGRNRVETSTTIGV